MENWMLVIFSVATQKLVRSWPTCARLGLLCFMGRVELARARYLVQGC